jgi:4-hydroxy-tetrahydrodipicolinate reductase
MAHRVIVWGTGFVGKSVLRELIDHPSYEIAAVIVNAAEKDGQDLGEILGTETIGIRATRDSSAALSLEADAVAYFGPSAIHAAVNMENLTAALRSGKNVVDTSMAVFHNPRLTPPELLEPIEAACLEGGTTFLSGGIDPGFANDLFPLTLLGLCGRVESVRTTEFIDAGTYPDQESLQMMGLMQPADQPALLEQVPGMMTSIWGGPLYMIAEALGVEIEETREIYRRWAAPGPVEFPLGKLEPGDCAAHRIELQGVVDGEPRIFIDHLHRMYPEAAPDWPRPQLDPVHANCIEIEGSPKIRQETLLCDSRSGDGNAGGCLATGMRVLNAIPAVCAAEPGIISTLDLPLIPGRGGMRAGFRRSKES